MSDLLIQNLKGFKRQPNGRKAPTPYSRRRNRAIFLGVLVTTLFLISATPVEQKTGYYVRFAPVDQEQFTVVDASYDVSGLREAHVIGDACYNEFRAEGVSSIRERIDCTEYDRIASVPNYPAPRREGYQWIGYKTALFDTPSGDLEAGYYAIDTTTENFGEVLFELLINEAEAAIGFRNITQARDSVGDLSNVSSFSYSHTVSGQNPYLLFSYHCVDTALTTAVTSVTWNGTPSIFRARSVGTSGTDKGVEVWTITNPESGTHTVTFTLDDNDCADANGTSATFTGVSQLSPHDNVADVQRTNDNSPTISLNTIKKDAFAMVYITDNASSCDITFGNQTEVLDNSQGESAAYSGPHDPGAHTLGGTSSDCSSGTDSALIAISFIPFETKLNVTLGTVETSPSVLGRDLVGHWTFDGPDLIDNVVDRSGNDNTGYLDNFVSTTTVGGKLGQALEFDGSDDEVHVGGVAGGFNALDGVSGASVSAWVNIESYGDSGTAFIRQIVGDDVSQSDCTVSFRIGRDGTDAGKEELHGHVCNNLGDRDALDGSTSLSLDTWYHVAYTWEGGGRAKLYIDGTEEADTAASGATIDASTSGLFVIGDDETRGRNWHGVLDDVRIHNRVLNAEEISRLYELGATTHIGKTLGTNKTNFDLSTDLVGHWTFDGPDLINNATDKSGQGNTGYLTNFTSTTTEGGILGQALEFDGSNDYVDVGAQDSLQITGDVSFGAWIKADTFEADEGIISTGNEGIVELEIDNVNYLIWADVTSGNDIEYLHEHSAGLNEANIFDVNLSTDTWYHVFLVRDVSADTVELYLDGVFDSTFNYTNDPTGGGSSGLNIGRDINLDTHPAFDGLIDDVRIYNRVLSAEEVSRLYNLGR